MKLIALGKCCKLSVICFHPHPLPLPHSPSAKALAFPSPSSFGHISNPTFTNLRQPPTFPKIADYLHLSRKSNISRLLLLMAHEFGKHPSPYSSRRVANLEILSRVKLSHSSNFRPLQTLRRPSHKNITVGIDHLLTLVADYYPQTQLSWQSRLSLAGSPSTSTHRGL
jgi:hypothetical protein